MSTTLTPCSESNNGFISSSWGSTLWFFLHVVSLNYPVSPSEEDIDHYHTFFMSLQYVLPCSFCRKNFVKNLNVANFDKEKDMSSRIHFANFIVRFHNLVNCRLHKDRYADAADVFNFYEQFRAESCDTINKNTNEGSCTGKKTLKCNISITNREYNDDNDDNDENNVRFID